MLRVKANFEKDLCTMAEQDLEARGIPRWEWKHARPRERRDVIRQLLTAEHRLIPMGRRQTSWSDLLKSRADDEWLQEARRIASESEAGADLNHYQSKRIARARPDAQLNDWGITHLHLGGPQPSQRFSRQVSELLFVMVRPEGLYFVDIGTHANFASLHLFETVHRNWPHLIARGRVQNISPETLTDSERAALRSYNLNATTTTRDGTVYLVPGSGSVASGIPSWIVRKVDQMVAQVLSFQEFCEQSAGGIEEAATKLGVTLTDPTQLALVEFGSRFVAHVPSADLWLWAPLDRTDMKMSRQPPPS